MLPYCFFAFSSTDSSNFQIWSVTIFFSIHFSISCIVIHLYLFCHILHIIKWSLELYFFFTLHILRSTLCAVKFDGFWEMHNVLYPPLQDKIHKPKKPCASPIQHFSFPSFCLPTPFPGCGFLIYFLVALNSVNCFFFFPTPLMKEWLRDWNGRNYLP